MEDIEEMNQITTFRDPPISVGPQHEQVEAQAVEMWANSFHMFFFFFFFFWLKNILSIHTYIHTHTHIYIYIYNKLKHFIPKTEEIERGITKRKHRPTPVLQKQNRGPHRLTITLF